MSYSFKQQIGFSAEKTARNFLHAKGLRFISQNYRSPTGEIDLIMQDGDDIVFVEVRKRNCINFGNAFESVNYQKRRKLIKTANHFLQRKAYSFHANCRFDIIAFHPVAGKMELEWLKNAFSIENTL